MVITWLNLLASDIIGGNAIYSADGLSMALVNRTRILRE